MDCVGPPKRHILIAMCFVGSLVYIALRLNLSVAIVSMVASRQDNSTLPDLQCFTENRTSLADNTTREFDWDPQEEGYILGAYYYGHAAMLAPGGILAQHFGGKRTFGIGMMAMTLFTLLAPVAARLDLYAFLVVRVLLGAAGGMVFPSFHVLLGKWIPERERGRLSAFVSAGLLLGQVVSQSVSGVLIDSGFLGGWPSPFYVLGVVAFVVCVVWMFVVSESPLQHKTITEKEQKFILKTVKHRPKKLRIPWLHIFTSIPFWSLMICQVCALWGLYTMLSYLPRYIEQTLRVSTQLNGVLTAVPYLVGGVSVVISGFLADFLHHKGLSIKNIRKIMTSIGLFVPAGFLVAMGYTGCDTVLKIALLSLTMGFFSFMHSGVHINHIDIAPTYAGVLFGITTSVSGFSGFAAPYVIGYILSHWDTLTAWRIVFFMIAGIFVFGATVFLIFADGSPQEWADENSTKEKAFERAPPHNRAKDKGQVNKETIKPVETIAISTTKASGQPALSQLP